MRRADRHPSALLLALWLAGCAAPAKELVRSRIADTPAAPTTDGMVLGQSNIDEVAAFARAQPRVTGGNLRPAKPRAMSVLAPSYGRFGTMTTPGFRLSFHPTLGTWVQLSAGQPGSAVTAEVIAVGGSPCVMPFQLEIDGAPIPTWSQPPITPRPKAKRLRSRTVTLSVDPALMGRLASASVVEVEICGNRQRLDQETLELARRFGQRAP